MLGPVEDGANVDVPAPTKETSGYIKAIGKDSVDKICSGQVVLSLAVAVKELVENAVDAGATLVEIKLRDQGLESLEVSDNGSGVEERNLEAMTAKYHTSKIREFVDLEGVETFGFRGEALSSLCALADMTIVTRHKTTGLKVELDHKGKIKRRSPCAHTVGTTVSLTNLFVTLPVRRRDFTRNIKREFARMCQILQSYCLVAKGVRIICSNQNPKGSKTVIMQTHGVQDVFANISAIFGSRVTSDIIALKSPFNSEQSLTQESLLADLQGDAGDSFKITTEDVERLNAGEFQLEGYISSCKHGAGRSSKDRQYFYINSRPCDHKSISRVVNDIYHRYNGNQYPFIFLNVITASRADVDVNLTPDKRQLLINNEKLLLLALKKTLLHTFGNIPSTYKVQNSSVASMMTVEVKPEVTVEDNEDLDTVPLASSQRFMDVLSQWKQTGNTSGIAPHVPTKRKCSDELTVRTLKLQKIHEFLSKEMPAEKSISYNSSESETEQENDNKSVVNLNQSLLNLDKLIKESAEFDNLLSNAPRKSSPDPTTVQRIDCKVVTPAKPKLNFVQVKLDDINKSPPPHTNGSDDDSAISSPQWSSNKSVQLDTSASEEETTDNNNACNEICTSLAEIELSLKEEELFIAQKLTKAKLERLRFKTEINPSQNQNAEAELQREISKDSFARMEILGQFNLGFIIVKLDTDLFIVDQHASDEKYNFETLQRTTQLHHQQLAMPQQLELTAINEMILLDNLEVFEKNGFKFQINGDAPTTRKVSLLGKPFSKNWEFGKDDIDELIFMLQDAPEGTVCRPSRIRSMFASRACRKSVMIGKALNKTTMKQLITHMGEIEQPWNCPHGRPTMRHLINTAMLLDTDEAGAENASK